MTPSTKVVPKMVRLPPDVAAAVATMADYEGVSQNEWLALSIERAIVKRRGDPGYMTGLAKHFAGKLEQLEP